MTTYLTILSSGNIGIGTTTPTQKLHVIGNTLIPLNNSYLCYTPNFGIGTGTGLEIFTDTGDIIRFLTGGKAGTERMRINNFGNVGIGTVTPNSKLHVEGTGFFSNSVTISSAGYVQLLIDQTDSAAVAHGITSGSATAFVNTTNNGAGHATGTSAYAFLFNGVERARFTSTGNLGIGTTNPSAKMHIVDSNPIVRITSSSTFFYNDFGLGYIDSRNNTNTSAPFSIRTGGTDRLYIDTGGNVGIGTVTPTQKLTVVGNIMSTEGGTAALPKLTLSASTTTGIYTPMANGWGVSTNGVSRLVIDAIGNVGVGTTNPTSDIHLSGDAKDRTIHISTGSGALNSARLLLGTANREWELKTLPLGSNRYDIVLNYTASTAAGSIGFENNGNRLVTISSAGNLFIGGTSVTSGIVLNKGTFLQSQENNVLGYSLYTNDGMNNRRIAFYLDSINAEFGIRSTQSTGGNGTYRIITAGVNRFSIFPNGNIGVGTDSDNGFGRLQVAGTIQSSVLVGDETILKTNSNGGLVRATGADIATILGTSASGSYILNGTTLQTANFNIIGNGFIGGNLGVGTTNTY
jgi:hypothetical protein